MRDFPVKWFKKATKNHFRDAFEEVDEHRSSKICPKCGIQLYSVVEYFNGKKYDVRGIMWCGSRMCSNCPFKDCDEYVACHNMFH